MFRKEIINGIHVDYDDNENRVEKPVTVSTYTLEAFGFYAELVLSDYELIEQSLLIAFGDREFVPWIK